MVIYEVVSRRVADPSQPGNMLDRGYTIHLEPDLYENHRLLELRLIRNKAFKKVDPKVPDAPTKPTVDPDGGLLPHQKQALDRLRLREPGPS